MRLESCQSWLSHINFKKGHVPDGRDGDEAGSVGGLEVLQGVHGGLLLGVELLGLAGAAEDVGVALVEAQADLTVDTLVEESVMMFVTGRYVDIRAERT